MGSFLDFWKSLGRAARIGFVSGLVLIALLVTATAYWTLHTTYAVLFSGLSQGDMATMAGELDKMKIPYKVGNDETTLLVPQAAVHKTRLVLMGRDLPLHGAVGFELFNNMDFGVSEFVQKIDYQRALQGELSRTIMSIEEVQAVRVHLALPDQGLFSKDTERAKASVTLALKPGRMLAPVQVQGIQRLVAASVPNILPQDVTVLDDHGVPLSRLAGQDLNSIETGGSAELELKRSVESYLAQKASNVLDRAFGKGIAVVSVDAVFVQEQTRVTTEEILPAHGAGSGQIPTGVIVRERQSTKDGESAGAANQPVVTTSETEYLTGKKTEQVVTPAGAIKRLAVAVVLRQAMPDEQLQRVRDAIGAALGINRERGDVITVQVLAAPLAASAPTPAGAMDSQALPTQIQPASREAAARQPGREIDRAVAVVLALMLVLTAVGALLWHKAARRGAPRLLSEQERTQLLNTIQAWAAGQTPASRP